MMSDFSAAFAVVCTTFLIFGIVFGFFAFLRYMRYRETLALAEKGLLSARYESNGKSALRWGVVFTAVGVALCLGMYPLGWVVARGQYPLNFGPWMLVGLLPAFFGLALVTIYLVTREKTPGGKMIEKDETFESANQEEQPALSDELEAE
jgi:4-hydroxybenzoate polyprenyltransferase